MIDPLAVNGTNDYVKRSDFSKTVEARAARLEALKANGVMLPKERLITDAFIAGKEARVRLAAVAANIPVTFGPFPDLEVSLICAQSGITAAIQTTSGGFDTHGDVTANDGANGSLARATNRLTYLWDEAARRGIADRLYVVAAGEFSRTELNGSNGNDHDSVGAGALIMGPPGWGLGNRVVGYTGPNHTSRAINPKTGAPDPNGEMITPAHFRMRSAPISPPNQPTPRRGSGCRRTRSSTCSTLLCQRDTRRLPLDRYQSQTSRRPPKGGSVRVCFLRARHCHYRQRRSGPARLRQ